MIGYCLLLMAGFIVMIVFCLAPVILSYNPPADDQREPSSPGPNGEPFNYRVFNDAQTASIYGQDSLSLDTDDFDMPAGVSRKHGLA